MTEARGYLQKAPREGAADLVACASVTVNSLPLARSLCVDLLTFLAKLSTPRNGGRLSRLGTEGRTEKQRERERVKEERKVKRNRMNGTSSRR